MASGRRPHRMTFYGAAGRGDGIAPLDFLRCLTPGNSRLPALRVCHKPLWAQSSLDARDTAQASLPIAAFAMPR